MVTDMSGGMRCVQVGLLDRLLKIVPPSLSRFFFANSGSEAVDNAIKVARAHTKRQNIICFEVAPNCIPSYDLQEFIDYLQIRMHAAMLGFALMGPAPVQRWEAHCPFPVCLDTVDCLITEAAQEQSLGTVLC